jgi:DNA-binding transcriptional regulator GbsR (MarR family)
MNKSRDKSQIFELHELTEMIGEFIQYWGFKKIHGKIWCLLFLSKTPLDANDFMEHFAISKALVSQSLTELKEYNVIVELGKGEKKTLLYKANPHLTEVIFGVLRSREKRLLCQIYASFRLLNDLPLETQNAANIDQENLKRLGSMIRFAEKFLVGVLAFEKLDFGSWRTIFK